MKTVILNLNILCLIVTCYTYKIYGKSRIMSFDRRTNFISSAFINASQNSRVYSKTDHHDFPIQMNASRFEFKKRFRSKRTIATTNDLLSKNISIILENLLKSYEKSQLPTHGQDAPTIVQTNMLIRSMGPVSEVNMDYSMDCYFRQYWRDKRLSFKGPIKSLSLSIKMLDKIWRPDTYFYNGKQSHIHTITVPNKLLRLGQDGDILYSMRLTVKATCPMQLKSFPMDRQSCPLIIGSYAYTNRQLIYKWNSNEAVTFVPGMTLNQFDLISMPHRNFTYSRQEGDFSVLHVSFNLKRHTGYFLIQVYVPCILIVVLSWVSFWIHREATSDRVGLCITTVLTLSTISLDSRKDLPKVKYATALDWFLLMSFFYCIATLLEFAGVHYFTKIGSGEIPLTEDDWEDIEENLDDYETPFIVKGPESSFSSADVSQKNSSVQIYECATVERTTQTEPPTIPTWKQFWFCVIGDDDFRRDRQRKAEALVKGKHTTLNSVSLIDQIARIAFPMSFGLFNLLYWLSFAMFNDEFSWARHKK